MELTGKTKVEFEKWSEFKGLENYNVKDYSLDVVYAMLFGVYVDFFDSVGTIISIEPNWHCGKLETKTQEEVNETLDFDVMVFGSDSDNCECETTKTRTEARTKAIEKANLLCNNRK